MKTLKLLISGVVWTVVGLYLLVMALLHVPAIQRYIGTQTGRVLGEQLGTEVSIGRIDLGFLNRIVMDDVLVYDQQHRDMLKASRLSAKIDVPALIDGKLSISSAQIFGMDAHLYKDVGAQTANFQFVIDSLSPKDKASSKPLNVHIQSLVIRNGAVTYHDQNVPPTKHFNPNHLVLSNISTHVNLNTLTDDSISLNMKELAFKEASGLETTSIAFRLNAGKQKADIRDLHVRLPQSSIGIEQASATYKWTEKGPDPSSLSYIVKMEPSTITPRDLACFADGLSQTEGTVALEGTVAGTTDRMTLEGIRIHDTLGRIGLIGNGQITHLDTTPEWQVQLVDFKTSPDGIRLVAQQLSPKSVQVPQEVLRLGNIRFQGDMGKHQQAFSAKGQLRTDAGNANIDIAMKGRQLKGQVLTHEFNVAKVLDNPTFGLLSANVHAEGTYMESRKPIPFDKISVKGKVGRMDYQGYSYRNIEVDGTLTNNSATGMLAMDDPNGNMTINGTVNLSPQATAAKVTAKVRHTRLQALKLTDALGNRTIDLDATVDLKGHSLADVSGKLSLRGLTITDKNGRQRINRLDAETGAVGTERYVEAQSDFGSLRIEGLFDYRSMANSLTNLLASKLPTLPGLPRKRMATNNRFRFDVHISNGDMLSKLAGIPLETAMPINATGNIDDKSHQASIILDMPAFRYGNMDMENGRVSLQTTGDTLIARATLDKLNDNGGRFSIDANAEAVDNQLNMQLLWDTHSTKQLKGVLNADANFYTDDNGEPTAHVKIHPSEIMVDHTKWEVQPSDIVYAKNKLNIDHFQVSNNKQYIIIKGETANNVNDSLQVDLHDINVEYVLDLVNFHSVKFSGYATGITTVRNLFGKPEMKANLQVRNFKFQDGNMGTLTANATYNTQEGRVDMMAVAKDKPQQRYDGKTLPGWTLINGYISPKENYIDLKIHPKGTRLEFLESFCGSFMDHVQAYAEGSCRVFGDLKEVNLEGKLVANGQLDIKTLNTTYTLRNDTITMVPDEIIFMRDTVYDRDKHIGVVNGALHHKHLTRLTFDLDVEAKNLLAYDFHDYGDQTFYGTVYGTGFCQIKGRKGRIDFDISAKPEKNSFIEYNAAGPDGISNSEFIKWKEPENLVGSDEENTDRNGNGNQADIPSDIRLKFDINTTPDFTLRVLMDEDTRDKISLNGDGVLHAEYFNKGAFEMYGKYQVGNGTYDMTIQKNIIERSFEFQPGSSINFNGDPFNAALDLKGLYTIQSVSLSDLQMGRSFTQNNIRVNCLLNIGGTPGSPSITFGLETPTLSADAQQMIRSVINSEEDMNQQVLYLLAVNRFLPPGSNNAAQETNQQNQTSLAMQSLISGTLSQQINNILSSVIKSDNWNFGANISTGDEGFNNAEYEGQINGKLLDNRLLINGEIGYRDNVNTDNGSSFIGDFDVQYLLLPNGNLAVKVYSETNERYFTRNSLTTQGIGLIMKKDFTSISDLLGKHKRKTKSAKIKATTKNKKKEKMPR